MSMREKLYEDNILLLHNGSDERQSEKFAGMAFNVGGSCSDIIIHCSQVSEGPAQVALFVFDPLTSVRLIGIDEASRGSSERIFHIGRESASKGGIPGPLPPGEWKLLIFKKRFRGDVHVSIRIDAETAAGIRDDGKAVPAFPANLSFPEYVPNAKPGWYSGEFHLHSNESTGRTDTALIYKAAIDAKLDFLALTDHFSAAHWLRIEELPPGGPVLFLQSMEISGDRGHANVHGIRQWINPFVDDKAGLARFLDLPEPPSMETIADSVHRQGGLFCINHPLSGLVAWRYDDFPLEKADLIEVWNLPDGPSSFLYPMLWDTLLCRGFRLTGTGSSDSHNPLDDGPWKLGRIRNWVYADKLSREGIIRGMKSGQAYIAMGDARLSFYARIGNQEIPMGGVIALEDRETCTVFISCNTSCSGNLFIIIDGMIHDIIYFESADPGIPKIHTFDISRDFIKKRRNGMKYIRIEFHEDIMKAAFYGMAYRDHNSMRLLSNPLWIEDNIL